jgi:hypothetical protein
MNKPKSILDVFYYPDLRAEIKKIKSLITPYMVPLSKTKAREIAKQIDSKFLEFQSDRDKHRFIRKIEFRMLRIIKSSKINALSNVHILKSSKQTFKEALNGNVKNQEGAIIKFLQTYYKAMYKCDAFHSMKEFDRKYRGFEISFDVTPINSKFAIVMARKYMQWKSYLHSTVRKAYAIVGLDDFGNTFIIFIHYGIANSIIRSKEQLDWEKFKKKIWGCKIDFQIGRYGLVKDNNPMVGWNYKRFNDINYITPLIIEQLLKKKINYIKIGNDFFRIEIAEDEFGKIDPYEIIGQE